MLETIIKLKQAMEEDRGKGFVYERFQDYFFWYESLSVRGIKEKIEFREIEEEYDKYMRRGN